MKKKGSFIFFLLIVLLIVREYVPFVASKITLTTSIVFFVVVYSAFTLELGLKPYVKYAAMFAIPIFDMLASIVSIGEYSFMVMAYSLLQIFIFALVGEFFIRHNYHRGTRFIYMALLLIMLITTVTTYYGNQVMPGASRNMATGLQDDRELMALYTSLNIGGFAFVYTLVLLLPFMFYTLKHYSDTLLKKILVIIIIIFALVTIYTTEYSTAILGSVLSLAVLFLPKRLTQKNTIIVMVALLAVGVVLGEILPTVLRAFSAASDSYTVSIRMDELGDILGGTSTSGDVQGRFTLWNQSWSNFIHNPTVGTGTSGGGHSFLLDTLSRYGLIGLVLILFQYRCTYKFFVKPYQNTDFYTLFVFVYILNFVFSIVNTYFYYNVFLVFIPLFTLYHSQKLVVTIKE